MSEPTEREPMAVEAPEVSVRAALGRGDHGEAIRALRPLVVDLGGDPPDTFVTETVRLAYRGAGNTATTEAARAVLGGDGGSDQLVPMGESLIRDGFAWLAIAYCEWGMGVEPSNELAGCLLDAYEKEGLWEDAFSLLNTSFDWEASAFSRYLYAFYQIMIGDLNGARRVTLAPDETLDPELTTKIERMLRRAEAASAVGALDLRGWHFVITGSVLLHSSPFGFEEMLGRYAFTMDSEDRCKYVTQRLGVVLDVWDRLPEVVMSPPDDRSEALGRAAAELLGARFELWPSSRSGLVVAYAGADAVEVLFDNRTRSTPLTLVHVHASQWIPPDRHVGDFTGYLHQVNVDPWSEVDGDKVAGAASRPPDRRPAPARAAAITATEPEPGWDEVDGSSADLAEFASAVRHVARGPGEGRLDTFWRGGPISSNYFYE